MYEKISRMPAGRKQEWKMYQTLNELLTWTAYIQESSRRFTEEFTKYSLTCPSTPRLKALQEQIIQLTKNSESLRSKAMAFKRK